MLKNNVGEEMAEMMSEEITKVMEEQRNIELEYARLVQQRDQLKGITNKHRLEETKKDIMVSFHDITVRVSYSFMSNSNRSNQTYSLLAYRRRTEGQHQEVVPPTLEKASS